LYIGWALLPDLFLELEFQVTRFSAKALSDWTLLHAEHTPKTQEQVVLDAR
jgi:hypothetical protein